MASFFSVTTFFSRKAQPWFATAKLTALAILSLPAVLERLRRKRLEWTESSVERRVKASVPLRRKRERDVLEAHPPVCPLPSWLFCLWTTPLPATRESPRRAVSKDAPMAPTVVEKNNAQPGPDASRAALSPFACTAIALLSFGS